MAKCKSCEAPIVWGRNVKTGKGVPLDPEPVEDGNLLKVGTNEQGEIMVQFVGREADVPPGGERFKTHFATCPDAPSHRKK